MDLYNRQGRGAYVNSVLSQNKLKEVLAQNGLNTQGVAKTSQKKILGDYQDEARSIVRERADTLASLDRQEKQAKANYKDEAAKIDRDLRKKLTALK